MIVFCHHIMYIQLLSYMAKMSICHPYMLPYMACGLIYVRLLPTYMFSKLSHMTYMLINLIIYDNICHLYHMYVDLYGKI